MPLSSSTSMKLEKKSFNEKARADAISAVFDIGVDINSSN
jgi:hypothetical protein